jgi:hypothetical protein
MNPENINVLKVIAYFVFGTLGFALLGGWALKRFGAPKE